MMLRPTRYSEFATQVATFKTRALLLGLGSLSSQQARREGAMINRNDLAYPWSISLIAREAIAASARSPQSSRVRATDEDIRALNAVVMNLEDPMIDGPLALWDDFTVRVTFQQFPYQQPIFHPAARMRPMYKRPYPASDYKVLSETVIESLLGTDIDGFVDSGPFFAASAGSNNGVFDPTWLDSTRFAPVLEKMPRLELESVFSHMWSAPLPTQRSRARKGRSSPRTRQYDYNPLVSAPWVGLPDGSYVAPQAWYVLDRVGPSGLYYAGIDAGLGQNFLDDLGRVNELYAVEQASQLRGRAEVHPEVVYDSNGNKKTVDILVVTDTLAWLIEVKSTRANLAAQLSFDAYMRLLHRDMDKAFKQLATTANLIREQHTALASLVPVGLPLVGSVVTAEPLYQANSFGFRQNFVDPTLPTAILSMRELEDAIAFGLVMPVDKVARSLTTPGASGYPNPHGAMSALQKELGARPRNPILDDAWDAGTWQEAVAEAGL